MARPEAHQRRNTTLAGWPVRITSYQLEGRYFAMVDNVSPGASIARGEGTTREEAESAACRDAEAALKKTRVLH